MSTSSAPESLIRAAGGLVLREAPGGTEIVVVHRPAYDDWSFPKGKLLRGESERDGAMREVEEEIGARCVFGADLGSIAYVDGKGRPKTVRYWIMSLDEGQEVHAAHEVDDARWVSLDQARGMLSYEHDRRLLARVGGPGTGTTVFLIRHAEAGERSAWKEPDRARPLSDAGRRQAFALAERFETTPIRELISSPFVRCVQTLEPLCDVRGLTITTQDELAEGSPSGYTMKIVLEAAADGPAAVCVHGDGMSDLLRTVADLDVSVDGSLDDHAKGSVWALDIVDGVIVSARYEAPPSV